jgi:FkbM family methyltransferase
MEPQTQLPAGHESLAFRLFRRVVRAVSGRGLGLHRIGFLSRAYDALSARLSGEGVVLASVDGQKMLVRADGSHIANSLITQGVWERKETEVFLSLLEPHMTFVDVGAHVGYYTLLAAKRIARVYAFEPDPESFALLTRSVQANGYTNVKGFAAAVTDRMGRATLQVDAEAWGNSLATDNVVHPSQRVEVETVGLDDLYAAGSLGNRIDLLKIDVQGAEELALKGARRILTECRPIILMEVEPPRLRNMGADPTRLLRSLVDDHGYRLRAIEGDGLTSVEDIVAFAEREAVINVVATPPAPG